MTQKKETTLLDSIQSEVSQEASPMLEFLVNHASKIFAALIAFIILLLVFGGWNYFSGSKKRDNEEALGKILVMPENAAKITALEEFIAGNSGQIKTAATLALAQSSGSQQLPEKSATSWAELAKEVDAPTRLIAIIAQANSLSSQGKHPEALAALEAALSSAPLEAKPTINSLIAGEAESLGEWDKAIAACDALVAAMDVPEAKRVWEQRRAYYLSKK